MAGTDAAQGMLRPRVDSGSTTLVGKRRNKSAGCCRASSPPGHFSASMQCEGRTEPDLIRVRVGGIGIGLQQNRWALTPESVADRQGHLISWYVSGEFGRAASIEVPGDKKMSVHELPRHGPGCSGSVVDEVGYLTHGPDAANVLFNVIDERHRRRRCMVFTTNKPLERWAASCTTPTSSKPFSIASSSAAASSRSKDSPCTPATSTLCRAGRIRRSPHETPPQPFSRLFPGRARISGKILPE